MSSVASKGRFQEGGEPKERSQRVWHSSHWYRKYLDSDSPADSGEASQGWRYLNNEGWGHLREEIAWHFLQSEAQWTCSSANLTFKAIENQCCHWRDMVCRTSGREGKYSFARGARRRCEIPKECIEIVKQIPGIVSPTVPVRWKSRVQKCNTQYPLSKTWSTDHGQS